MIRKLTLPQKILAALVLSVVIAATTPPLEKSSMMNIMGFNLHEKLYSRVTLPTFQHGTASEQILDMIGRGEVTTRIEYKADDTTTAMAELSMVFYELNNLTLSDDGILADVGTQNSNQVTYINCNIDKYDACGFDVLIEDDKYLDHTSAMKHSLMMVDHISESISDNKYISNAIEWAKYTTYFESTDKYLIVMPKSYKITNSFKETISYGNIDIDVEVEDCNYYGLCKLHIKAPNELFTTMTPDFFVTSIEKLGKDAEKAYFEMQDKEASERIAANRKSWG